MSKKFKWGNFNGYLLILVLTYLIALDGFKIFPTLLMPLYFIYVYAVWKAPGPLAVDHYILQESFNHFSITVTPERKKLSDVLNIVEYTVDNQTITIVLPRPDMITHEQESDKLWMQRLTPYTDPVYRTVESEEQPLITRKDLENNTVEVLKWCHMMLRENIPFQIDDTVHFFDSGDPKAWFTFLKQYKLGNIS